MAFFVARIVARMRYKLTPEFIAKLKPPSKGSKIYFGNVPGSKGGHVPGFAVRVNYGGKKTYLFVYRFADKQKKHVLGTSGELDVYAALDKARDAQAKLRQRIDPAAEERQECTTITDLVELYKADAETQKKRAGTLRNERGIFKRIIVHKLGHMRIEDVTQKDVSKLHASLSATPYHGNRMLALLSILFNFGIKSGYATSNPAKGVKRYSETARTRWLSSEELERLSTALESYQNQEVANAIRLLLLTGARPSEVLRSEWSEFDLPHGQWERPSHHTKTKRTLRTPLSDAALQLLKGMAKNKASHQFLFPGAKADKARVTLQKPWQRICRAAGLVEEVRIKGKRRDLVRYRPTLRLYDATRHSFASHLVNSGVSLYAVSKLLGHVRTTTTERYSHLADGSLRDAANKFPGL
jgi:integrase